MTYIEFFDKSALENVGTCLTCVPDRVIFLGDNAKRMKKSMEDYSHVFASRGLRMELLCKAVSRSNLDSAVETLSGIVETYPDCVFDITGGDEMLNLALGIVYQRYPDKNIQIHRLNLRNGTMYDCDKDGTTVYREVPTLSVEELIRIYGGDISTGENASCEWDLNGEFIQDIDRMWEICKEDVRKWNIQTGIFGDIEAVGQVSDDGLTTVASQTALLRHLEARKLKYKRATGIVKALYADGLLTAFSDGEEVTVSYKNPQVKACLTKAGQVLEMKVYTAALRATRDGKPVYSDGRNGVVIDWDGAFHDERSSDAYDTENEIDVLMMHNAVPVFISCKNGSVTADELYKLNTVAERFGGPYAKKVLVATALNTMGDAAGYLRQRAADMNIRLIEDIQHLEDAALMKKLEILWCS